MTEEMDVSPGRGIWAVIQFFFWVLAIIAPAAGVVWLISTEHPVTVIREQVLHLPSSTATVTETPWPTETPAPTLPPTADVSDAANEYRQRFIDAHNHLIAANNILFPLLETGMNAYPRVNTVVLDALWQEQAYAALDYINDASVIILDIWPPSPYDSSNPLLDSHARLEEALAYALRARGDLLLLLSSTSASSEDDMYLTLRDCRELLIPWSGALSSALVGYNMGMY